VLRVRRAEYFRPRRVVFKPMIKCSGRNRYFLTTLSKVTRGKSAYHDVCHVGDYPYSSAGNKIFSHKFRINFPGYY